ncbi:NAD-dependent epimerase/dehydratase family protein [Anaerolinea thermophila]|uniref:UDP-glucose 4-epimerase n=1 Tax=Anaerolinea thermophila (strain DSM 14523 / JCM 11388 / NBRC 100420 / UNI-1) TaxID=926569 RepID=E8N595_ANATU|nr:NAD-dependent epimerase/dehydratase family protein [Anaerolinea thermophila]BAJ63609.1 putative UDP-glucose 4-epimerase [Anaerolinea thermophila UNI-1]
MKILVTGGAGFIGSHVVDQFIEAGHDVVVVDNLSTGREKNLNPKARFYRVDIRDPELRKVFEIEKPEVVDHHAAQMNVRRSVADPLYDADVNVRGSVHLLELCREYGVRKIIYISSGGAVYGEPVYLPCDEEHPVRPLCPYGLTKYAFELYLYIYQQNYGIDYTVFRYPNVYGPRQDPLGEAGVIAIFTGQMLRGEPVTIYGTGDQVRDYVHVYDCARANLLALESGSGRVYNLGSGKGTTVNELFQRLKAITGYSGMPNYAPAKLGETFKIYLNAQRAKEELGWVPTISLEEGLRNTVEYTKQSEIL